jgi:hypothetical protein
MDNGPRCGGCGAARVNGVVDHQAWCSRLLLQRLEAVEGRLARALCLAEQTEAIVSPFMLKDAPDVERRLSALEAIERQRAGAAAWVATNVTAPRDRSEIPEGLRRPCEFCNAQAGEAHKPECWKATADGHDGFCSLCCEFHNRHAANCSRAQPDVAQPPVAQVAHRHEEGDKIHDAACNMSLTRGLGPCDCWHSRMEARLAQSGVVDHDDAQALKRMAEMQEAPHGMMADKLQPADYWRTEREPGEDARMSLHAQSKEHARIVELDARRESIRTPAKRKWWRLWLW